MKYKIKIVMILFQLLFLNNLKANDFISYISSDYEIYAPDEKSLALAKIELKYAQTRFRSLIGENPPKIRIVLFNSNKELVECDSWKFNNGLYYLKLLTHPVLEKMLEDGMRIYKDKVDELEQDGLKLPSFASSVLSHEAAHEFLINYVNKRVITSDSLYNQVTSEKINFYGHPLIPDWFDEALAVYCEQKDVIQFRIQFLKKKIQNLISLSDLINNERDTILGLQNNSGFTIHDLNKKSDIYYAQTIAFLSYLIDKEGRHFIKKMIVEYVNGADFYKILQSSKVLPCSFIELENDFKNWLEKYKYI